MQSNWKTLETEVQGVYSSVQQQITISHLHEHPEDHQERSFLYAVLFLPYTLRYELLMWNF